MVVFAFHLAETISALFQHVLEHLSKVLYDPETEPLFLPIFWFYPIYREMLNSASRHRPSKSMELRRAASGLVKVICRTEDFFLLYAAWVRSRAERPSVSYTKVVMEVARTGHNLQNTKTN